MLASVIVNVATKCVAATSRSDHLVHRLESPGKQQLRMHVREWDLVLQWILVSQKTCRCSALVDFKVSRAHLCPRVLKLCMLNDMSVTSNDFSSNIASASFRLPAVH
jgi:hypothetical protein